MRTFLIAIALLLTLPVQARTICTEPLVPFCVDISDTYEDELALRRCHQDLTKYTAAIEEYVQCLSKKSDEIAKQANEIRRRFDCKERGETNCP